MASTASVLATITSLEKQLAALKAQLGADPVPAEPSVKKAARAKKESAERAPREPTAWRLFADRVRSVLRSADYEGTALGVGCVQFCKVLKEENGDFASWSDEDILARRAAWAQPERAAKKKATPESDTESAPAPPSPSGPAAAGAGVSDVESTTSSHKKRGPAKGTKWSDEKKAAAALKRAATKAKKTGEAAALPLPPSPPPSEPPSDDESSFKKVLVDKKAYWVNQTNGHAYFRNPDDSRGDWAGIFHRTGAPKTGGAYVEKKPAPSSVSDVDELD